ncbi:hypothetical protein Tco_1283376 [Tanacetum coccineum]
MKRRKGDGGSSSKKKKSPTDTSNYERFKDDDKPRQEQEEVAQHDEFTGEHAYWFKQPGEKRVKLLEQNWFNELVNADKDLREYELQIGSTVMFAKSMQNFLNKEKITKEDLKGIHHWKEDRQWFYKGNIGHKSAHDVYSKIKIISVKRITVERKYGYGYLKEIVVKRADQKEHTFLEADFSRLN